MAELTTKVALVGSSVGSIPERLASILASSVGAAGGSHAGVSAYSQSSSPRRHGVHAFGRPQRPRPAAAGLTAAEARPRGYRQKTRVRLATEARPAAEQPSACEDLQARACFTPVAAAPPAAAAAPPATAPPLHHDLSKRLLTAFPAELPFEVTHLNLSENKLPGLTGLAQLPHLVHLDASDNCLTSLADLRGCSSSVEVLLFFKNSIRELGDAMSAEHLPALRVLNIFNNKMRKVTPLDLPSTSPRPPLDLPHLRTGPRWDRHAQLARGG